MHVLKLELQNKAIKIVICKMNEIRIELIEFTSHEHLFLSSFKPTVIKLSMAQCKHYN